MSKWVRKPEEWETSVTGELIWKMTKKRSKTELQFTEDKSDPWFIHEYTVEKKSKKVTNCSVFIAKDLPEIIAFRIRSGWELEEISSPTNKSAILNNITK